MERIPNRPVRRKVHECLRCGQTYENRPPRASGCGMCGNMSFFPLAAVSATAHTAPVSSETSHSYDPSPALSPSYDSGSYSGSSSGGDMSSPAISD